MARPHSSASSRSHQHHAPGINLTALQGATLAFNASSSPGLPVKNHLQAMGTTVFSDSSHRRSGGLPSQSHPPSDTDSNPPPEIGSVSDKIGRFAATSRASSPLSHASRQNVPDDCRRDLKLPIRPHTPQQVAARLATERSRIRDEKSAAAPKATVMQHAQDKTPTQLDKVSKARQEVEIPAPKAIRNPSGPSPALQKLLQEDQREPPPLPQRPPVIPRKPVSPTSPKAPSLAQLAAARSSPTPSSSSLISRKPPSVPSRSSTFPTRTTTPTTSNANSRSLSPFSDKKKPALPPRPPRPNGLAEAQTVALDDLEPSKPSITPSNASLSTLSHNDSSTSTVDRPNGMDEESLSNAIVASSIASARAPSPKRTKIPPPPPKPRRRSRSRSILNIAHRHNNSHDQHPRLPSPAKGSLRQTLRDPPKPDISHNHPHHRLIHRHPHKHHEGDRKRWQSSITEQERKRYEGVWAANKGLLLPFPPPPFYPPNAADMVLNLVVRDIWSRSRLPTDSLLQIWELVDTQKTGLLSKEEFVVGMWLIDQQLKGHKLPGKVPDSVWDSVRRISGVKAPSLI